MLRPDGIAVCLGGDLFLFGASILKPDLANGLSRENTVLRLSRLNRPATSDDPFQSGGSGVCGCTEKVSGSDGRPPRAPCVGRERFFSYA
jgi:hypothetical protein